MKIILEYTGALQPRNSPHAHLWNAGLAEKSIAKSLSAIVVDEALLQSANLSLELVDFLPAIERSSVIQSQASDNPFPCPGDVFVCFHKPSSRSKLLSEVINIPGDDMAGERGVGIV